MKILWPAVRADWLQAIVVLMAAIAVTLPVAAVVHHVTAAQAGPAPSTSERCLITVRPPATIQFDA